MIFAKRLSLNTKKRLYVTNNVFQSIGIQSKYKTPEVRNKLQSTHKENVDVEKKE